MPTRRFERIALLFVSGCAIVFAATGMYAHAQYIPPPTPLPPPIFNPSSPYTVPQPTYRPIAPSAPSTAPDYVVTAPVTRRLATEPSRQRTPAATRHAATRHAATRHAARHRGRVAAVGVTPESYSYYYSPFGYGYGCAWRRSWDGYWFRTSPCS